MSLSSAVPQRSWGPKPFSLVWSRTVLAAHEVFDRSRPDDGVALRVDRRSTFGQDLDILHA